MDGGALAQWENPGSPSTHRGVQVDQEKPSQDPAGITGVAFHLAFSFCPRRTFVLAAQGMVEVQKPRITSKVSVATEITGPPSKNNEDLR